MKKALVVLLALTALAGMAFAQDAPVWTWGLAINTGVEVMMGDSTTVPDSTIRLWETTDTTAAPTHARFTGAVAMGDFGAHFYLQFLKDDPFLTADFANWWVTANLFNKMVQVNAGVMDVAFSGTVNKGWGGTSPAGLQVIVMPIEGLKVGFAVPVSSAPAANLLLAEQLKAIQLGAFYTMPNLASFALTYAMGKTAVTGTDVLDNSSEFDFGVNVLAVPNLKAQVEGRLVGIGDDVAGYYEFFENAEYVMGALKPAINLDEVMYQASGSTMKIAINPSIDYMVMTGTNVGLSITYTMNSDGITGGDISGLNVDPYVKFTFDTKAAIKIDANYTIMDLSDTSLWKLPIQVNFVYAY